MRPARLLLALAAASLMLGCSSEAQQSSEAGLETLDWQQKVGELLARGKHSDAIKVLEASPRRNDFQWFHLLAHANATCYQQEGNPRCRRDALEWIDKGLRRFPESSYLLASKAGLYLTFGEQAEAQELFQAARSQAEENIAKDQTGLGVHEDREVLKSVEAYLAHEGRTPVARMAGMDATLSGELLSSVIKLLEEQRCEDAVEKLQENARRLDPQWFELLGQANAMCFNKTRRGEYRQAALSTVEDGLNALPRSSRLLRAKGTVHLMLNEPAQAQKFFEDARRQALENIANDRAGYAASDDRAVLEDLEREAEKREKRSTPPERPSSRSRP